MSQKSTEEIILQNLIYNEEFSKKVLPYFKVEYFQDDAERVIFKHIDNFYARYNKPPTPEALFIEIGNDRIQEKTLASIDAKVGVLKQKEDTPNLEWLVKTSEEFCQERSLHNGLMDSIAIMAGEDKTRSKGAIPDILQQSLAVSFDTTVGHDYVDDWEKRYEYYHRKEEKIPFDLDFFNKITKNGISKKTLNIIVAGTNAGKSAFMCHMSAYHLQIGKNVLYITMEMSEEEISRRIDANVMDIDINDVPHLSKQMFEDRIAKIKRKKIGKLKVKEFPTGACHVGHINVLINELKLKQNFVPDVIYVDYIGIMASQRIKQGAGVNTNTYLKEISIELRELAVQKNVPVVSAMQFNRGGMSSSDPRMEDTAESIGINFTADFVVALIATDELIQEGKVMVSQLKSRYDDKSKIPKFFIGFDRPKMKYYDLDAPTTGIITSSGTPAPVPSASTKGGKFGGFNYGP